jgi:ATP-dependent helicase YprA (DUF1998 family)
MTTPASPADRYAVSRRRAQADGPRLGEFQRLYDFQFDDFQLAACRALDAGHGVLVAAPTGSGKTVAGEFAVHLALAEGKKCFYTTPIKALSNQKYSDLVRRYSAASVGLLTGDNSINSEAPIVVMTTEVLRNMLYAGSPTLRGLGYVVLDEVHYLADRFRGAVWEEVIIHLDQSVRLTALSATVSNAEEFGDWLSQVPAARRAPGRRAGTPRRVRFPRPARAGRPGAGRSTPSCCGSRSARAGAASGRVTAGVATGARSAAATGPSGSGRRAARPSSPGWTPPGCCPRSPSSSAGPAATLRSRSAWTRGCG